MNVLHKVATEDIEVIRISFKVSERAYTNENASMFKQAKQTNKTSNVIILLSVNTISYFSVIRVY